ncbi:MAG: type II toxin-antitoxin system prevent-host-death family antitoxin [Bauldia sp.]
MNKQVSKSAFKARALELLREVEQSGQSLVVTDRGKPVVEVRPLAKADRPDPREYLRGKLLFYLDPTEPVGAEDWEALKR